MFYAQKLNIKIKRVLAAKFPQTFVRAVYAYACTRTYTYYGVQNYGTMSQKERLFGVFC
jgi:hypothetical protein